MFLHIYIHLCLSNVLAWVFLMKIYQERVSDSQDIQVQHNIRNTKNTASKKLPFLIKKIDKYVLPTCSVKVHFIKDYNTMM